MSIQVIETTKGVIEYSLIGNGAPLLFVHGGHGNCNETLFHKGYDQEKFCLITPSRPGYGKTPLKENRTPRQCADLFIALLDKLSIKDAIVIGISAGGLTAIEIAANYPNRTRRLVLISAVTEEWLTKTHPTYKKGKMVFSPRMEQYSWVLFRMLYTAFPRLMARILFRELSFYRPVEMDKKEIGELRAMISQQRSFSGFINDLDQTIERGVLERIIVPVLLLHSLYDKAVGAHHAFNVKAKIPRAVLKTYKNRWGHLLWLGAESDLPIKDTIAFITQTESINA